MTEIKEYARLTGKWESEPSDNKMTIEDREILIFVGGYFFGIVATIFALWVCGVL